MPPVPVEIRPKPNTARTERPNPVPTGASEPLSAQVVDDMDHYLEHAMCSCSAGDDNPY